MTPKNQATVVPQGHHTSTHFDDVVLGASGLSKAFGATRALQKVDLTLAAGQVTALVGGNGAGKSTLMRILTGITAADSGTLRIGSRTIQLDHYNTRMAFDCGIFSVYQELSLCNQLTVVENFMLTHSEMSKELKRASAYAEEAMRSLSASCPVRVRRFVEDLSLAERQLVEIARAMSQPKLRVLILDEPTSALDRTMSEWVYDSISRLRGNGIAVLLVTHHLEEGLEVSDSVTVMRDGEIALNVASASVTPADLVQYMARDRGAANAGSSHAELLRREGGVTECDTEQRPSSAVIAPCLKISGLSDGILNDVSLTVGSGELIGLAGPEGGGQRDLLHTIWRSSRRNRAAIERFGAVSYVSGDRAHEGVFPLWTVGENIVASALGKVSRAGFIDKSVLRRLAQTWFDRVGVRAPGLSAPILSLSGGNQQKVLLARGFATGSELVLLDDPTRGVDALSKVEVQRCLREILHEGRGALLYSTDDDELTLCTRVYVMREGRITTVLEGGDSGIERAAVVSASFAQEETPAS